MFAFLYVGEKAEGEPPPHHSIAFQNSNGIFCDVSIPNTC